MFHRHVGQIGQNHGFATFMEMRETQGNQNYSNNINAPLEMFTSIAVVDRQIMELGYQNYSNNIGAPFEMFTSIAVVDM